MHTTLGGNLAVTQSWMSLGIMVLAQLLAVDGRTDLGKHKEGVILIHAILVSEDTYIIDGEGHDQEPPHSNRSVLWVSKNDTDPRWYVTLMRFDVEDLNISENDLLEATIEEKILRCDSNELGEDIGIGLRRVHEDWDQRTVDGVTPPALGELISHKWLSTSRSSFETTIHWEVTSLVRKWLSEDSNFGIAYTVDDLRLSSGGCGFYSAESAFPPTLYLKARGKEFQIYLPSTG